MSDAAPSAFVELVGCRLPLQLAAMGGIGTPELAAAVSRAGGLGTVPGRGPDAVERSIEEMRASGDGPVAISFLMPFLRRESVEVAARLADVVEFFYGEPDRELVEVAGRGGAVVGWQVGTAREATAARDAGCGFIVVQGVEAGGHLRGSQPLDVVLEQALQVVDVPVLAAGGIGTSQRVEKLFDLGVAGVRVGTRFIAAAECQAHPAYVEALIGARARDTVVTEAFGADWPHAPHRVLRSALKALERFEGEVVGSIGPWQMPRASSVPPTRGTEGVIEAMALYAGQSVDAVRGVLPAAQIVQELMGPRSA